MLFVNPFLFAEQSRRSYPHHTQSEKFTIQSARKNLKSTIEKVIYIANGYIENCAFSTRRKVKAIAAEIADDSVALAMKSIFSQLEIYDLDIADGLKELLYEKKYNLNSLLQSDADSVSDVLGIEKYVAKLIIDAAKRRTTE